MSPEKNAHFERNRHLSHHSILQGIFVGWTRGVPFVGRESSPFSWSVAWRPREFILWCSLSRMPQDGPQSTNLLGVPWSQLTPLFSKRGGVKFHLQLYIPGSPKHGPPCFLEGWNFSGSFPHLFFLKKWEWQAPFPSIFQKWWALFLVPYGIPIRRKKLWDARSQKQNLI